MTSSTRLAFHPNDEPGLCSPFAYAALVTQSKPVDPAFGARFVAEAVRLGVPLSATQIQRLSRGTKGQIMRVVEERVPLLNPELLRLLGRRGPEELARELSRRANREGGVVALAGDVVDTAYALDVFGSLLSGLEAL